MNCRRCLCENAKTTGRMLEVPVELSEIRCLPYHKIRNTPTLPGAWILDRLVIAAMQLYPNADRVNDVTVEDVSFKRFVRFANGQEPNLRVIVQESDGSIFAWMLADVLAFDRTGSGERRHLCESETFLRTKIRSSSASSQHPTFCQCRIQPVWS